MKKKYILICALSILLFCYAASPPKFWQGLLRTPTAEWAGAYGTGDQSWLGFNCYENRRLVDAHTVILAAMMKELDELKAVVEAMPRRSMGDPNNTIVPAGSSIELELTSSEVKE